MKLNQSNLSARSKAGVRTGKAPSCSDWGTHCYSLDATETNSQGPSGQVFSIGNEPHFARGFMKVSFETCWNDVQHQLWRQLSNSCCHRKGWFHIFGPAKKQSMQWVSECEHLESQDTFFQQTRHNKLAATPRPSAMKASSVGASKVCLEAPQVGWRFSKERPVRNQ